jgi:hypothetical protein
MPCGGNVSVQEKNPSRGFQRAIPIPGEILRSEQRSGSEAALLTVAGQHRVFTDFSVSTWQKELYLKSINQTLSIRINQSISRFGNFPSNHLHRDGN